MDGRWKKLLAGGLLIGLAGCASTKNRTPPTPGDTSEPPLSAKHEPKGPPKVETLLALAGAKMASARVDEQTERDRDRLHQEAKVIYAQILEREPKNLDAMLGMAHAFRGLQDKNGCVEWYQRALKANPSNAAAIWGEMGQSLDAMKDREAAINCYHTAAKLEPSNKDYKKALGYSLARAGRYEEGFAWLSRCKSEADAHVAIAQMMDHNGQPDQAFERYKMALKCEPANQKALLALQGPSVPAPVEQLPPNVSPIQTIRYEQPVTSTANDGTAPAVYSSISPLPAERPDFKPANPSRVTPPPVQGWIQSR